MKKQLKGELIKIMESGVRFSDACKMLNLNRITPWRWRKQSRDFDRAFQLASLTVRTRKFVKQFEKLKAMCEKYGYREEF